MKRRPRRSLDARRGLAACLLAVGAAGAGAPPHPGEPVLPETIAPAMATMRDWIRNATMRLRSNVVGIHRVGTPEQGAADGPAMRCCASNIQKIDESIRRVAEETQKLAACYEREHDNQMRANLEFALVNLDDLRRALSGFAGARDRRQADVALAALSQSYIHASDDLAKLRSCGAPDDAPAAKPKKSKKKKRAPEPDGDPG